MSESKTSKRNYKDSESCKNPLGLALAFNESSRNKHYQFQQVLYHPTII